MKLQSMSTAERRIHQVQVPMIRVAATKKNAGCVDFSPARSSFLRKQALAAILG